MGTRIRKNDIVQVISGKDKGSIGKVLKVIHKDDKVIVEDVNVRKKATRPDPASNQQGGMVEEPMPIHISKVLPYCNSCSKGIKVKFERDKGKVIRKCRSCNTIIENK